MTLTKDAKINYLNIGLMALSAVSAFFYPFETFLLAYAYLGPLHYLTEISWLHDRKYFTKGKYDFLVLLIIGVLLSYAAFAKDFGFNLNFYNKFAELNLFDILLVLALFSAIVFVFIKNLIVKIIAIFLLYAYVSGWLSPDSAEANSSSTLVFAFTSLLPTLIHVYAFTALFMLYGALKSRSKTGLLSVLTLILFPVILVFYAPVHKAQYVSEYGKNAYYANGEGFFNTNVSILDHFKLMDEPMLTNKQFLDSVINKNSPDNQYSPAERAQITASLKDKLNEKYIVHNEESKYNNKPIPARFVIQPASSKEYFWNFVFFSKVGIMLMRFIAFAYLYHYLNWFSKTEVIRWHKVPKVRFAAVILIWLAACGAYAYSYQTGLTFLFFLSFTHVLLEFPLNVVSIVGIGQESFNIFKHGFKKKEA